MGMEEICLGFGIEELGSFFFEINAYGRFA